MITGGSIVAFFEGIAYIIAGAFLDINQNLISILLVFCLVDTLTGLLKVLKVCSNFYTIRQIILGFCAKISILTIPLILVLLLKAVDYKDNSTLVLDIILRLLILSEFISILRNIYTLVSGKIVQELDLVSYVIGLLIKKSLSFLKKYLRLDIDAPDFEPPYKENCPSVEEKKEQGLDEN